MRSEGLGATRAVPKSGASATAMVAHLHLPGTLSDKRSGF